MSGENGLVIGQVREGTVEGTEIIWRAAESCGQERPLAGHSARGGGGLAPPFQEIVQKSHGDRCDDALQTATAVATLAR